MFDLQAAIDQIGTELVSCNDRCAGIWLDQSQGIVPRSLILERPNEPGRGCLAVGLNPGTSKSKERSFYLQVGVTYDALKQYSMRVRFAYASRARNVIDQIGLHGPIM